MYQHGIGRLLLLFLCHAGCAEEVEVCGVENSERSVGHGMGISLYSSHCFPAELSSREIIMKIPSITDVRVQ